MAQIRTFVGKLPDLQQEHQSLRTRKYLRLNDYPL
jgi:hypothetical protein